MWIISIGTLNEHNEMKRNRKLQNGILFVSLQITIADPKKNETLKWSKISNVNGEFGFFFCVFSVSTNEN